MVKNNLEKKAKAQGASSARANQYLVNTNDNAGTSRFIGFAAFAAPSSTASTVTSDYLSNDFGKGNATSFSFYDGSDNDILMGIKMLAKKGALTKSKALVNFRDNVIPTRQPIELRPFIGHYCYLYGKLILDNDRQVRQLANEVLYALIGKMKPKVFHIHIALLLPHWLLALHEMNNDVAKFTQKSFDALFTDKTSQDIVIVQNADIILESIWKYCTIKVDELSDRRTNTADESEERYERCVSSALNLLSFMITTLQSCNEAQNTMLHHDFCDINSSKQHSIPRILTHADFLKMATLTSSKSSNFNRAIIRQSAYKVITTALIHCEVLVNNFIDVFSKVVFSSCGEKNSMNHEQMWNCVLYLFRKYPTLWENSKIVNSADYIFLPRLYSLIRHSFYGSAAMSYPNLLPCVAFIPFQILLKYQVPYEVLINLWKCLESNNAQTVETILQSFLECFAAYSTIFMTNKPLQDATDIERFDFNLYVHHNLKALVSKVVAYMFQPQCSLKTFQVLVAGVLNSFNRISNSQFKYTTVANVAQDWLKLIKVTQSYFIDTFFVVFTNTLQEYTSQSTDMIQVGRLSILLQEGSMMESRNENLQHEFQIVASTLYRHCIETLNTLKESNITENTSINRTVLYNQFTSIAVVSNIFQLQKVITSEIVQDSEKLLHHFESIFPYWGALVFEENVSNHRELVKDAYCKVFALFFNCLKVGHVKIWREMMGIITQQGQSALSSEHYRNMNTLLRSIVQKIEVSQAYTDELMWEKWANDTLSLSDCVLKVIYDSKWLHDMTLSILSRCKSDVNSQFTNDVASTLSIHDHELCFVQLCLSFDVLSTQQHFPCIDPRTVSAIVQFCIDELKAFHANKQTTDTFFSVLEAVNQFLLTNYSKIAKNQDINQLASTLYGDILITGCNVHNEFDANQCSRLYTLYKTQFSSMAGFDTNTSKHLLFSIQVYLNDAMDATNARTTSVTNWANLCGEYCTLSLSLQPTSPDWYFNLNIFKPLSTQTIATMDLYRKLEFLTSLLYWNNSSLLNNLHEVFQSNTDVTIEFLYQIFILDIGFALTWVTLEPIVQTENSVAAEEHNDRSKRKNGIKRKPALSQNYSWLESYTMTLPLILQKLTVKDAENILLTQLTLHAVHKLNDTDPLYNCMVQSICTHHVETSDQHIRQDYNAVDVDISFIQSIITRFVYKTLLQANMTTATTNTTSIDNVNALLFNSNALSQLADNNNTITSLIESLIPFVCQLQHSSSYSTVLSYMENIMERIQLDNNDVNCVLQYLPIFGRFINSISPDMFYSNDAVKQCVNHVLSVVQESIASNLTEITTNSWIIMSEFLLNIHHQLPEKEDKSIVWDISTSLIKLAFSSSRCTVTSLKLHVVVEKDLLVPEDDDSSIRTTQMCRLLAIELYDLLCHFDRGHEFALHHREALVHCHFICLKQYLNVQPSVQNMFVHTYHASKSMQYIQYNIQLEQSIRICNDTIGSILDAILSTSELSAIIQYEFGPNLDILITGLSADYTDANTKTCLYHIVNVVPLSVVAKPATTNILLDSNDTVLVDENQLENELALQYIPQCMQISLQNIVLYHHDKHVGGSAVNEYVTLYGQLLTWDIFLKMFPSLSNSLSNTIMISSSFGSYVMQYKILNTILSKSIACLQLANSAIRLQSLDQLNSFMPTTNINSSSSSTTTSLYNSRKAAIDIEMLSKISACILYRTVVQLPTMVRLWWNDECSRNLRSWVAKFFEDNITPLLVQQDFETIRTANETNIWDTSEMIVKTSKVSREITTTYIKDECTLEMVLKIPSLYPLRSIEVECTKRIGISEDRWRRWVLQILKVSMSQDGSLLDAVIVWKQNMDQEFQGVEPCPICYSILNPKTMGLPNLECKTCHNKYHNSCLYKWFNQSGKNKCPICQQPFS